MAIQKLYKLCSVVVTGAGVDVGVGVVSPKVMAAS
jgi:hypothetical protein